MSLFGCGGQANLNLTNDSYDVDKYESFRQELPAELTSHFPPKILTHQRPARLYYRPGGLQASRRLQLKLSISQDEAQRLITHYQARGIPERHGWTEDLNAVRFEPNEATTRYPTDLTSPSPRSLTIDDSVFILVGVEPRAPDPVYCAGIVVNPKRHTVRYFTETDSLKPARENVP